MQDTATWHQPLVESLEKRNLSWGIYRLIWRITCNNDGESASVDAVGDLLRRGRGPEPAETGLARDER